MPTTSSNAGSPVARRDGVFTLLIFLSIALVLIVVNLSAYLRLAGSGLGCAEWPSCYALIKAQGESGSLASAAPGSRGEGRLPSEAKLHRRESAGSPQETMPPESLWSPPPKELAPRAVAVPSETGAVSPFPECVERVPMSPSPCGLRSRGPATTLVPPWATVIHRLTASALGILVLSITLMAIHRRKQPEQYVFIPVVVLGLTVFLSVLGYITPSPLLPWVTLGNLLGGMAMLAMLWWLGQRSVSSGAVDVHARGLRPWAFVGIFIVFLQLALGGWVSANFAALACTDFPDCGAYPWTAGPWHESFNLFRTLAVTADGTVISGDAGKVMHMFHRAGAVLVFLYIVWLGWRAAKLGNRYRKMGITMIFFLLLQLLLGTAAVVFSLPLVVVTAHNAIAALLLLSVVNLYHHLTPRTRIS